MNASIIIDQLSKRYVRGQPPALDKLTLHVNPGEVYGFLGANGAGKSTTIRLLMNFLQPTGGSASVMDYDVTTDAVRVKQHVGYLAGDVALYRKTTGRSLLDFLTKLQGGKPSDYRAVLEQRFQAELDKPIAELSKGNRQKIGILQACMHQPAVLILDEPTSGLDPLMQEAFYETLTEAKNRGAAVFMSSHNLAEAQRVCDRLGVIKHGKLIREQTIQGDTTLEAPIFKVVFANAVPQNELKKLAGLRLLSSDGKVALLQPTETISQALKVLSRYDIQSLTSEKLDLESEFLEFYEDAV
jgi:ABC-2 type transport system ATP-binding protein